jgi:hypothetical protein
VDGCERERRRRRRRRRRKGCFPDSWGAFDDGSHLRHPLLP